MCVDGYHEIKGFQGPRLMKRLGSSLGVAKHRQKRIETNDNISSLQASKNTVFIKSQSENGATGEHAVTDAAVTIWQGTGIGMSMRIRLPGFLILLGRAF